MEFVLDASFTLHWCFEDEATPASDAVLTRLQNQTDSAWVPGIWPHELLNGLGKGIIRNHVERQKAFFALAGNTGLAHTHHRCSRQ